MRISGFLLVALLFSADADAACTPPKSFVDTPAPSIAPPDELAAHSEEIVIDRPLAEVRKASESRDLAQTVKKTDSLPGVTGTYLLTPGFKTFGAPGSRQFDCLSDGSNLEEQSLEREVTAAQYHFRYVVWNYTSDKAKPIAYGVGEFRYIALDAGHTRIHWTYSFALKPGHFPGYLGALGRWLFHIGFLDGDYAALMRNVLAGMKTAAEKR